MGMMALQINRVAENFNNEHHQVGVVLRWLEQIGPRVPDIANALEQVDKDLARLVFQAWDSCVLSEMRDFDVYGMLLVKTVDNFNIYLTELLTMVFDERPDTLRHEAKGMQLSALEVLKAEDVNQLIADKKVANLDGRGVNGIVEFFASLGANIEPSDEEHRDLNNAIALRNLVVHRRRRVDQTFLDETERTDVTVDTVVRVTSDDTQRARTVVGSVQKKIASAVGAHFKLTTHGPGGIRRPKAKKDGA